MDPSIVTAYIFLSSIAHIGALKRGPFNEHSPIMHNIATTVPNWQKVNSGLMKMYQAEVLEKHPVVQHFWFGGILPWTKAGTGQKLPSSGDKMLKDVDDNSDNEDDQPKNWQASTQAPWAKPATAQRQAQSDIPIAVTAAPWARGPTSIDEAAVPPRMVRDPLAHATQRPYRPDGARQPTQSLASTGSAAAMSSPLGAISQPSTGYPRSPMGR